jgi:hypothetical protein
MGSNGKCRSWPAFGIVKLRISRSKSRIMFNVTLPMKHNLLIIAVVCATASPSFALTEADLAPAAIAGKTLTFTIANGGAPFATNGNWSGKFGASPGNSFTMTKVTGDTVNSTGTWTFNSTFAGLYEYTLSPFIAGQPDAVLTLWISGGAGRYEVFLNGVFGNAQTGGFTLGAAANAPDIAVQQPAGSDLTDGTAKKSFGTVKVGKSGAAKTFTIKNTGTTKLSKLAIKKSGTGKNDFVVGALGKTSLAAGASTTFKVTFKPTAKGARKADIQIASNDPDENPFDIKLVGEGAK